MRPARLKPVFEERASAEALAEHRLSRLKIEGKFRRFLVARMGSTGSAWLAKLLCSHPDVYCSHEGVVTQVYPNRHYAGDDVLRFIEYFAWDTKHLAYKAVGDVGSVWSNHLSHLRSFTTALLVRHPARLLRTRLKIYPRDRSFTTIPFESRAAIREIWGINSDDYDPIDRIFLHDIHIFAAQAQLLNQGVHVIRIEDMQDAANCHRILKVLTGLDYGAALVDEAIRTRVNNRAGRPLQISRIVSRFSPRQREWYRVMLADVVPHFGYELMDEPSESSATKRSGVWSLVGTWLNRAGSRLNRF